jgi:hypothetical protein
VGDGRRFPGWVEGDDVGVNGLAGAIEVIGLAGAGRLSRLVG